MARKVGGYAPSTAVVNAANIQTAKTVQYVGGYAASTAVADAANIKTAKTVQ